MKKILAFDVNGTLTQPAIQELFNAIDRTRYEVVIWSSVGEDYARKFARSHNLTADRYLTKNEIMVDLAIDDAPRSVETAQDVVALA